MGRSTRAARFTTRAIGVLATALVAVVAAAPAPAATIDETRAQAAEIAVEVDKLETKLAGMRELLRSSRARVKATRRQVKVLEAQLRRDEKRVRKAEQRLLERMVVIYQDGSGLNDLMNLMTAGSFSTLLDRIDAAKFVSEQDQQLVTELQGLRAAVAERKRETDEIRKEQQRLLDEAEERAADIRSTIAEREAVLGGLQADIRAMVEAERRAAAARAARESAERAREVDPLEEQPPPQVAPENDKGSVLTPPVLPPASGGAAQAASIALQQVGKPYLWGATGPDSFDCSGLVNYAFSQVGISLPRTSGELLGYGTEVPLSQLQPGDLVFHHAGHVGIYVGGGSYVHAPQSGRNVEVVSLPGSVTRARRV